MEYQPQYVTKFKNFLPPLKKYYGQDSCPAAAAVEDRNMDIPSPHCAICLSDVCGNDRYRKLVECGHGFHAHCIELWFQSRSTCPLCRVQVPEIISLNEAQYQWSDVLYGVLTLLQDFVERICNPLNAELASMLCENGKYMS